MKAVNKDLTSMAGYSYPFEGGKHAATIILLPYREDTWRDSATPALDEFYNVIKAITPFERVVLVIDPRIDYQIVKRFEGENITILRERYDDAWARDNTPIFLKGEQGVIGVDFGFNAWGGSYNGLYQNYQDDDKLGRNILLDLRIPRYPYKSFILEGGSVISDGEGTLITTSECLLSKGRNPSLTKEEIEETLKKTLGVKKVIFLPYGIYQDETSGHVDNIACFLKSGTISLAWCEDKNDPQYERSKADLEVLENETDAEGRRFEIIKLPLPKPQYLNKEESDGLKVSKDAITRLEGRRLSASYNNLYLSEKFLLLPAFGDENDEVAKRILTDFYKGEKEIIQIYSREILLGGGNIHCITKEIPYSDEIEIEPKENEK